MSELSWLLGTVTIYYVDCDSAGDFQSITNNIIARNRRSTDVQYSYPEDRPLKPKKTSAPPADERKMEDLEATIDSLADMVLSLQKKVSP